MKSPEEKLPEEQQAELNEVMRQEEMKQQYPVHDGVGVEDQPADPDTLQQLRKGLENYQGPGKRNNINIVEK